MKAMVLDQPGPVASRPPHLRDLPLPEPGEKEVLCDAPLFTGYDVNGGYAEYMVAPEDFIYPLPEGISSREAAPFLCAGIIGYRALMRSAPIREEPLGLYGFGASAHILIQTASSSFRWQEDRKSPSFPGGFSTILFLRRRRKGWHV